MEVEDEYVQLWMQEQLREAPELTDAQRRRLARLLRPVEQPTLEDVTVDERYL